MHVTMHVTLFRESIVKNPLLFPHSDSPFPPPPYLPPGYNISGDVRGFMCSEEQYRERGKTKTRASAVDI